MPLLQAYKRFFWFDSGKKNLSFLGDLESTNIPSEFNWPLICSQTTKGNNYLMNKLQPWWGPYVPASLGASVQLQNLSPHPTPRVTKFGANFPGQNLSNPKGYFCSIPFRCVSFSLWNSRCIFFFRMNEVPKFSTISNALFLRQFSHVELNTSDFFFR